MINIYSESSLHKTLKDVYALQYNGKTEQNINGKICDILAEDGTIIEVQSGNLSKLTEKLNILIQKHPVRVVYPLCKVKYIETSQNGEILSRRKSPKRQNLYDIFKELTSLYTLLLHPDFTLEVIESEITEYRVKTDEPVQLINKSRRFRKNWYKTDKKLEKINAIYRFNTAQDFLQLLPAELSQEFCAQDLAAAGVGKNAHIMVWVLHKMGLLEFIGKKKRKYFYIRSTLHEK